MELCTETHGLTDIRDVIIVEWYQFYFDLEAFRGSQYHSGYTVYADIIFGCLNLLQLIQPVPFYFSQLYPNDQRQCQTKLTEYAKFHLFMDFEAYWRAKVR